MKQILTLILLALSPFVLFSQAPCTTTNATGCQCANAQETNCDLIPDITISDSALLNYMGGPNEVPGRLYISASTPNLGFGPFTVGSVSMFVCGQDTINGTAPAQCPDGSAPKQLVKQKIYHKNGNTMTFWERWAGSMTYHAGHGHMHVDDWGVFTLRVQNLNDPNPLNWPIVGSGAKLGFCLMDYSTCDANPAQCHDSLGNRLTSPNFPNYGLGGGQYGCSPVEQGISSGYTDIYSENLDGMWIDIPAGTCNGNYWIVIEVDPNNNFLETNESNNWCAVPWTLTQQSPGGQGLAEISASGPTRICDGEALTLSANAGSSYTWSTGDTTQNITVSGAGTYSVTVASPCGLATDTLQITATPPVPAPTVQGATICEAGSAMLSASGTGPYYWYDAPIGGNLVNTGPVFNTPTLNATTAYYVESEQTSPGTTGKVGPLTDAIGTAANHQATVRYLIFDAHVPFTLKSVWVNASGAGNRVIALRDASGNTIQTVTVNVPDGQSRITLNLNVPQGTNLRLGTGNTPNMTRNSSGVSFPYVLQDICTITQSSAAATGDYYYFFYDWEVETLPLVCSSPRTTVTATVIPNPNVSFSGLADSYTEIDPVVTLSGNPLGGTFTGPGVSGNTFDPALAGVGGPYLVTYSFTDANGCAGTYTDTTWVTKSVGVLDLQGGIQSPAVYPNPARGSFTLAFEMVKRHQVTLTMTGLDGKTVFNRDLGRFSGVFREEINISGLPGGVYFIELNMDGQKFHTKLVCQ